MKGERVKRWWKTERGKKSEIIQHKLTIVKENKFICTPGWGAAGEDGTQYMIYKFDNNVSPTAHGETMYFYQSINNGYVYKWGISFCSVEKGWKHEIVYADSSWCFLKFSFLGGRRGRVLICNEWGASKQAHESLSPEAEVMSFLKQ